MLEISLNNLKANLDIVKMYMRETATKVITVVDYVSCDEGMCTAQYCICQKEEIQSSFEAFITLWNYQLHLLEGWVLAASRECPARVARPKSSSARLPCSHT